MFEPDVNGHYTSFCIANELGRRHNDVCRTIEKIFKTVDSTKISSASGNGIWIEKGMGLDKHKVYRKCFKMNLAGLHYVLGQFRISDQHIQRMIQDIAIDSAKIRMCW